MAGALGFWLTHFAISLTPLAADYRSALSIPYVPMLLEALVGGLVIGLGVACPLVLLVDKGTSSPVLMSLTLSGAALVIVTVVIEVPAKFLTAMAEPMRYFLIGSLFNVLRILALGAVVAVLSSRRRALAT